MSYVNYEVQDRIGFITLNRPEKRNALNAQVVTDLKEAFTRAEKDNDAKVIVLQATGSAFCAGADLAYLEELQKNSFDENLADSNHLKELFLQIYTLSKVVIAKVHGHAIAGGCGLALVCDFSFTVPEAMFGYTEVRIGFVPAIVKVFLLRKIGEGRAKDLLLTGQTISAKKAHQIGLVNKLVEQNSLNEEVSAFAKMLIDKNSGQSMGMTKQMIAAVQSMTLEEGLNYAAEMNAKARGTSDCKKGISSFLNKEKPTW